MAEHAARSPSRKLSEFVEGRSVALVGNSSRILQQRPAKQIDGHDIVIRINRGVPSEIDHRAIGDKTSILALARYWPDLQLPSDCKIVLWMKLTKLGGVHLQQLVDSRPPVTIHSWRQDHEDACKEFVGADPSTGIRILWWLRNHAKPRSVSCFGMDCWDDVSHWSGRKNTPNHNPGLEYRAMMELL